MAEHVRCPRGRDAGLFAGPSDRNLNGVGRVGLSWSAERLELAFAPVAVVAGGRWRLVQFLPAASVDLGHRVAGPEPRPIPVDGNERQEFGFRSGPDRDLALLLVVGGLVLWRPE